VNEKRNIYLSPKSRLLPDAFSTPLAKTSMFAKNVRVALWKADCNFFLPLARRVVSL